MTILKDPENKHKLDYLINMHMPVIHAKAESLKKKGWLPNDVDASELIMPGIHGLMHAVGTYDSDIASRKMRDTDYNTFMKYAMRHIEGRMMSHAKNNHVIDPHLHDKAKQLETANNSAAAEMKVPAVPALVNPSPTSEPAAAITIPETTEKKLP